LLKVRWVKVYRVVELLRWTELAHSSEKCPETLVRAGCQVYEVVRNAGDEPCLAAAKAEQNLSIVETLNGEIRVKTTAHPYHSRLPREEGCSVIHDIHNALEQGGRNIKRLRVEHAPVEVLDAIDALTFPLEQLSFESRMRQSLKQTGPGQGTPPPWLPNSAARHGLRKLGGEALGLGLDKKSCQAYYLPMIDIQVIDDPAAATVALDPMRSRLLSELAEPASAAALATRVGLARQKVNYHLRALEANGLVQLAEERRWGGLTERLLVATAASYVVSPSAMGLVAVSPERERDRLSASYLIALGARMIREVGDLVRRATATGKRLATLSIDTEVRFRSPTERAAFTHELSECVARLVSKYHDESAPGGRAHRLVIVAHPISQKSEPKELLQ